MNGFWEFAGNYWWLVFPLSGVIGGWIGGVSRYNERRRRDKIEMLKIKHGAQAAQAETARATQSQIDRALAAHDEVNQRWFDYELDIGKLIDFPMMTDVREPMTAEFHRTKLIADDLRPDDPAELHDPAALDEYRRAVQDYRAAFDIAEREAKRRRRSDFSATEQDALARARKLIEVAAGEGGTPAERQNAYRRARKELDGLIVLPSVATGQLEARIAGALESGR